MLTLLRRRHSRIQRRAMTPRLKRLVRAADGWACRVCPPPPLSQRLRWRRPSLHVDHKHPVSRFGFSWWPNLWTLCRYHNLQKGTTPLRRWLAEHGYRPHRRSWWGLLLTREGLALVLVVGVMLGYWDVVQPVAVEVVEIVRGMAV